MYLTSKSYIWQCMYVKSIKVNYLEMVVNMTLQQLKYIIMVAETGTITEAASRLFISQPSLTNAIHELEK